MNNGNNVDIFDSILSVELYETVLIVRDYVWKMLEVIHLVYKHFVFENCFSKPHENVYILLSVDNFLFDFTFDSLHQRYNICRKHASRYHFLISITRVARKLHHYVIN